MLRPEVHVDSNLIMKIFVGICYLLLVTATPQCNGTVYPGSSYDGSLVIGAFNIQTFGVTKVGRPHVVEMLVKILKRYDLVLIQEIRDSSGTAIQTLLENLNSNVTGEGSYTMALSRRIGRTSYKEQYAYFYKPSRLTLLWSYVYDDTSGDVFEREPFVAYFESPTTAVNRFGMIGIHTTPREAVTEINHLVDVYDDYINRSEGNTNAIIGGDFNADCSYASRTALRRSALRLDQRFHWIIPDDADTTVASSDCAYDRFVLAGADILANYQPNKSGVFYFDREYHLDSDTARDVSDHYPIELYVSGNPVHRSAESGSLSSSISGSVSCSGSFRAVAWMCLFVVSMQVDMPQGNY